MYFKLEFFLIVITGLCVPQVGANAFATAKPNVDTSLTVE